MCRAEHGHIRSVGRIFDNTIMKRPYKTKKKKAVFKAAYERIGDINLRLSNLEIEIECFVRNESWYEAIERQKQANYLRLELLEMGKDGWDITYTCSQVSGIGATRDYPSL
jgi:hypothetical protein